MSEPGGSDAAALEFEGLGFAYPGRPESPVFGGELAGLVPLAGLSLILGANAAGKTTLARLLAELDQPASGRLRWPEEPGPERMAAGVVFEQPGFQFQAQTVREELSIGLLYRGMGAAGRKAAEEEAAARFGLGAWLERSPLELDQPGQLAVLIAAFLLLHPRLLILDCSLTSLEPPFRERLIETCCQPGGPALLVLSRTAADLAWVGDAARVRVLQGGRLLPLPCPLDRPELPAWLAARGIELPWYTPLAAALWRAGLGHELFFRCEEELVRLAGKLTAGNKPPGPAV